MGGLGRRWFVYVLSICGLVSLALSSSSITAGGSERGPPSSAPDGLSEQTEYVKLGDVGQAVAFGDFNGDRFVDLLLSDKYMRTVRAAFWNHDEYSFDVHDHIVQIPEGPITGVAVADFNNDGLVDVIVSTPGDVGYILFNSHEAKGSFQLEVTIPNFSSDFLVLDVDNDLVPDIFVASSSGERGFLLNSPPGKFTYQEWNGFDESCRVTTPNSNAFVDMDGDCLPDLVLTTTCGIEVWSNPASVGSDNMTMWSLSSADENVYHKVEPGMWTHTVGGQLTFADFNGDGAMDILYADARNREVVLLVNQQATKRFGAICRRDPNWRIKRVTAVSDVNFVSAEFNAALTVPPTLRVGDFNLDGVNDFVGINAASKELEVYKSVFHEQPHCEHTCFLKHDKGDTLLGLDRVLAATFFDLDDSGRQDILAMERGRTRLLWNNNKAEADFLFFKGTALSGGSYFHDPRPFAPMPGNTFTVMYNGGSGNEVRTCSQCPQSAYLPLQRCNCFFGMRRVVNYIGEMALGAAGRVRSWQGLMPNSMALIWIDSADSTKGWWMEYFTQRRGGQMLGVIIVLGVCLVVLGVVILYLSWRERIEDRKEKQQNSELFGFADS